MLDHATAADQAVKLVKAGASVADGMDALVTWCEGQRRHASWKTIRRIDWAADTARLGAWLAAVLRAEPPASAIDGLYFGLFNPTRAGVATADLYVAGNPYDPEDGAWVCSPAWWPRGRYAKSRALDALYRTAYRDDDALKNDAEYPVALGYAVLAVRALCRDVDRKLLLGDLKRRVVATGFDSGDILTLGSVSTAGLRVKAIWT